MQIYRYYFIYIIYSIITTNMLLPTHSKWKIKESPLCVFSYAGLFLILAFYYFYIFCWILQKKIFFQVFFYFCHILGEWQQNNNLQFRGNNHVLLVYFVGGINIQNYTSDCSSGASLAHLCMIKWKLFFLFISCGDIFVDLNFCFFLFFDLFHV